MKLELNKNETWIGIRNNDEPERVGGEGERERLGGGRGERKGLGSGGGEHDTRVSVVTVEDRSDTR
jgi:hypothetical protein